MIVIYFCNYLSRSLLLTTFFVSLSPQSFIMFWYYKDHYDNVPDIELEQFGTEIFNIYGNKFENLGKDFWKKELQEGCAEKRNIPTARAIILNEKRDEVLMVIGIPGREN